MARVTVEDCIDKVSNRFELVMAASQRARKLGSGASPTVDRDRDKNPVIALREIAKETIVVDHLREEMISNYQRYLPQDEEEETIDLMDGEKEWGEIAKAAATERMYTNDELDMNSADDEDDGEPSLEDVAGA